MKKKHKLPRTDSIQKLANFWDTHDLTDFDEDLEEVRERVFERDTAIHLVLLSKEAEAVRALAKTKGVADTELIREWILEKIDAT